MVEEISKNEGGEDNGRVNPYAFVVELGALYE